MCVNGKRITRGVGYELEISVGHSAKSVRIRSYSGPYFPAFGLNTERYGVFLGFQSECGKMQTSITPNAGTFHAVEYIFHGNEKAIQWAKRTLDGVGGNVKEKNV